jgi:N-acetylmuramoyl-L-alanine amidase
MIGQPGAIWIPTNSYSHFKWPYYGGRPRWIIIHGTASGIGYSAQSTAHDFQNRRASTHYVIGYDGTVVQCVSEEFPAWGNGIITGPAGTAPMGGGNTKAPHDAYWNKEGHNDPNGCTISIEHSKSTDNLSPLSALQQKASFATIDGICRRWAIPRHYGDKTGGITGHYSIEPTDKAYCPGTYPWAAMFNYIGGQQTTAFPDPTLLTSPTVFPGFTLETGKTTAPPVPLIDQVHTTLTTHDGFYAIALAVDEAEQFPGWIDLTTPMKVDLPSVAGIGGGSIDIPDFVGLSRSIGETIADNFLPFIIRSDIVIVGLVLLVALLLKPTLQLIGKGGDNAENSII